MVRPPAPAPARAVPVLVGERLRLRPLLPGDAALYLQLYTDWAVMHRLGGVLSPAAARRSFAIACTTGGAGGDAGSWWTLRDGADRALGLAGLAHEGCCGELGVIVAPPHQGAGVARRALARLARYAFDDMALARLVIRHAPDHQAMASVAAHLGFQRDPGGDTATQWCWARRRPTPPR